LRLAYENKDGGMETIAADPVSLTVRSILGEKPAEAQLRPIQDIIPVKGVWRSHWPWAAGLTGGVLALIGGFWWYRYRRSRNMPLEMAEPPHIGARKAIEALERKQVFEKGYVKEYYFVFSEIIRRYLGSIRNFPAAEFTTEEISHHIHTEEDRKLLPLLRRTDLVKFADFVPTPAGKEADVRLALSYINETCPASDSSEDARRVNGGHR
jgi:hypothetical protein